MIKKLDGKRGRGRDKTHWSDGVTADRVTFKGLHRSIKRSKQLETAGERQRESDNVTTIISPKEEKDFKATSHTPSSNIG